MGTALAFKFKVDLAFHFAADPDPASHNDKDQDPASQYDADLCESGIRKAAEASPPIFYEIQTRFSTRRVYKSIFCMVCRVFHFSSLTAHFTHVPVR